VPAADREPPEPAEPPKRAEPPEPAGRPEPAEPGAEASTSRQPWLSNRRLAVLLGVLTVILVVGVVLLLIPMAGPHRSAMLPPVPTPAGTTYGAAGVPGGTGAPAPAPVGGPSGAAHAAGATGPTTIPGGVPGGPSAAPGPSGATSASPSGPLRATYTVIPVKGPGPVSYHVTATITNPGAAPVTGWLLVFTLPPGATAEHADGATAAQVGNVVTLSPKDPGRILKPGQNQSVKFDVSGAAAPPTGCTINGSPCG
jgi:hypothetical protein